MVSGVVGHLLLPCVQQHHDSSVPSGGPRFLPPFSDPRKPQVLEDDIKSLGNLDVWSDCFLATGNAGSDDTNPTSGAGAGQVRVGCWQHATRSARRIDALRFPLPPTYAPFYQMGRRPGPRAMRLLVMVDRHAGIETADRQWAAIPRIDGNQGGVVRARTALAVPAVELARSYAPPKFTPSPPPHPPPAPHPAALCGTLPTEPPPSWQRGAQVPSSWPCSLTSTDPKRTTQLRFGCRRWWTLKPISRRRWRAVKRGWPPTGTFFSPVAGAVLEGPTSHRHATLLDQDHCRWGLQIRLSRRGSFRHLSRRRRYSGRGLNARSRDRRAGPSRAAPQV